MDRIICKFIYRDSSLGDILVRPYRLSRQIKFRIANSILTATVPYNLPLSDFLSDLEYLRHEIEEKYEPRKLHFEDGIVFSSYWLSVTLERGNVSEFIIKGKTDKYVIVAPLGEIDDDIVKRGIYSAMRHRAKQVLPPLVRELAIKYGFSYKTVKINSSSGRWGSCSSAGSINLSLSLMALPEYLTKYVILHELCHTRFMSHGDNFYRLLDKCAEGKSEQMKFELKKYTNWLNGSAKSSE